MNKKGIILLAVLMIAGGSVFASGQQDADDSDTAVRGRNTMRAERNFSDCDEMPEEVSMTGTVDFTSRGTLMTVAGEEWRLMYPQQMVNIDIEDGTEITVKGWVVELPDQMKTHWEIEDYANIFHVTSAEIDGETFELDFGPMGRGGDFGRGFEKEGRRGGASDGRPMMGNGYRG